MVGVSGRRAVWAVAVSSPSACHSPAHRWKRLPSSRLPQMSAHPRARNTPAMNGHAMDESTWRQFTDPHGCFRIEIPASWQVDLWDGSFTHGQHGRVWQGTRFVTELHSLVGDTNTWSTSVTIRIEQFDGTLP